MADSNTHINYTIEDINRYLNGGMSSKEMHDMEKAALQDSFLADAIEGYSEASMQQSQQHLNEITALLQRDKEEAKVVAMSAKNFQWWKIAAMIIIVAGVGMFSWYIISMNKPNADVQHVAVLKENNTSLLKDTTAAIIPTDTLATTLLAQQSTKRSKSFDAEPKELKEADKRIAFDRKEEQENLTSIKNADDNAVANSDTVHFNFKIAAGLQVSKSRADSTQQQIFSPMQGRGAGLMNNNIALNQFSGVVLDNNNQPVPGAIVIAGEKRTALTDNNGYFKMLAADSILPVSVSSVGYETAKANLSLGFANKISIEPDQQSLSEVVVSGYSSKKRDGETIKHNQSDSAFPAGGWESFQEYVYKKMNIPFDSTNNDIITMHGAVEIEFSVDADGDPYNFNVLKSSGKDNDDKVIKAIKEGPRWITSKKNKKGKVAIQF